MEEAAILNLPGFLVYPELCNSAQGFVLFSLKLQLGCVRWKTECGAVWIE